MTVAAGLTKRQTLHRGIILGAIGSLLLHSLLMTALFSRATFSFPKNNKTVFEVTFSPLDKKQEQIVSEPEAKEVKENPAATLLAEKNRATEKEQIKRGVDPNAARAISPNQSPTINRQVAAQKVAPQKIIKPQVKAIPNNKADNSSTTKPSITSLRLNDATLLKEFSKSSNPNQTARDLLREQNSIQPNTSTEPFSRPMGSGARFIGASGIPDHLPHLPDGDITLLNTKASQYAVFVRRVATRVFSKLRQSGWETLSARDITSMRDFSTVTAVLSPKGDLISVTLTSSSGSRHFDNVLTQAAKAGTSDPHPPKGAEAPDGNIHFIFKAKSWSRVGPSRGGKGISEQRWLLLATGLG